MSARVSRITGETISGLLLRLKVIILLVNLLQVYLIISLLMTIFSSHTNPIMDETNKQFVVRQFKGIEEIVINQSGSGMILKFLQQSLSMVMVNLQS